MRSKKTNTAGRIWSATRRCLSTLVCILASVCISETAIASVVLGPIANPANGKQYYLLSPNTWTAAEAEAVILGGHLVTIHDAAENTWVYETFAPYGHPLWIGLNDAESVGTFVWASGEPATYRNWWCRSDTDCEPNSIGVEHYVEMNNYVWNNNVDNNAFYAVAILPFPPPSTVVTGRVVDADTGGGLPGDQPPFASVTLEQCVDYGYWGYCYYLASTQTEAQGDFRFQGDLAGNFRIRVNADPFLYEQPVVSPIGPTGYESVLIARGTSYDFGAVPLVPIIPVDAISGQVIDQVTGRPLAGTIEPFARVQLYRASPFGFEYTAEMPTSGNGYYMFTSAVVGRPLLRGDYWVVGYADQYQAVNNSVEVVSVQAHEARVAPVLALLSNPVRITDVAPCDSIPAQGGKCDFAYSVTVGTADRMEGVAWSLVRAWGTGGLVNATDFLACEQPLSLIPGTRAASAVVRCQFTVPASVPEYAYLCPDARFGEGSRANPNFTVQGLIDPLFCLTKLPGQGSLKLLPQPAAGEKVRQRGNHR